MKIKTINIVGKVVLGENSFYRDDRGNWYDNLTFLNKCSSTEILEFTYNLDKNKYRFNKIISWNHLKTKH